MATKLKAKPSRSSKPAKPPAPTTIDAATRDALIERAKREGRHSDGALRVCDGCREWVTDIYFVTLDRQHLCYGCTPEDKRGNREVEL